MTLSKTARLFVTVAAVCLGVTLAAVLISGIVATDTGPDAPVVENDTDPNATVNATAKLRHADPPHSCDWQTAAIRKDPCR